MRDTIRVLVVDSTEEARKHIAALLASQADLLLVGQAATAKSGLEQAAALQPDIVLMAANLPGMDGIAATEALQDQAHPVSVIIMSEQGEQEQLRRAMMAGARNFLVKPFDGAELQAAIRQAVELERRRRLQQKQSSSKREGQIVTVFSTKGGIGKTMIATNLAVALAEHAGKSTVLVDGYLQFGDAALFLNLTPQATIADLVKDMDHLEEGVLRSYLTPFSPKLSVLAAPHRPEEAENISGMQLVQILKRLKDSFDFVVVDSPPSFADSMLNILDLSNQVVVVTSLDLPTIKNIKMCLEIMDSLGYPRDKLLLLLNRANSQGGMTREEVEATLKLQFDVALPSDGPTVVGSVNRGVPLVLGKPEAPIAQALIQLVQRLAGCEEKVTEAKRSGLMDRLKLAFSQP